MRTYEALRREGGISGGDVEEDEVVREPESVLESLLRNCWEESSGERGNCAGRMRGDPKTASAGERLVLS
jgi:hypothetical protein